LNPTLDPRSAIERHQKAMEINRSSQPQIAIPFRSAVTNPLAKAAIPP
jgi:hypothetical protein